MRVTGRWLLAIAPQLAACSIELSGLGGGALGDATLGDSAADDASIDAALDAKTEAAPDAAVDATLDASADTSADTSADATADTPPPPCANGVRDGDETDVDCGGSCKACGAGKDCIASSDCAAPLICRADQPCTIADSCLELHRMRPALGSGAYPIDPDAGGTGAPFEVYCDMTTDGGGWTLVLAYGHAAGTNPPRAAGTRPRHPTVAASHFDGAQLLELAGFEEVRFFCETSLHPRKIHFKTSDTRAVAYVRGTPAALNVDAMWKTGFVSLAGHSAGLPASTESTPGAPFNPALELRLTEFPFFKYGVAHFAIAGHGSRWECDDWANGDANATLHQVWVR